MSKKPFLTSKDDAQRIARAIPIVERLAGRQDTYKTEQLETNQASVLVKTPGGGIPARSGTTLGKADCTIQQVDKSTDGVSDGNTLSVYNVSDTEIAGNIYVTATRDRRGNYVAESTSGVGGASPATCSFTFDFDNGTNVLDITDFNTTDNTKFGFNAGLQRPSPVTYVNCLIYYTGFYRFVPGWPGFIQIGTTGVWYWNASQEDTYFGAQREIRLPNTFPDLNRFAISLPNLIHPDNPQPGLISKGDWGYKLAANFTFYQSGSANGEQIVPEIGDFNNGPNGYVRDGLSCRVLAVETNIVR